MKAISDLWRAVTAPLSTGIGGFVDRVVGDEAVGWAFDSRRPGRRVLVVAVHRGAVVGETLADLPRRDLEGTGKGDGRCGFRLKLPSGLPPEAKENLIIAGVAGLRRQPLKKAGRFRYEAAAATQPKQEATKSQSAGFVERFVDNVVKGWALNPNHPERPAEVDFFDGERFLGSAVADIERPRLRETAGAGARGFEFRIPVGRKVAAQALRARISGTRVELRFSRSYPGDLGAMGDGPTQHGGMETPVAEIETRRALSRRVAPGSGLLFLISGAGDADAIAMTADSCRLHGGGSARVRVASRAEGVAADLSVDSEDELRTLIAAAQTVVFLSPGQILLPGAADAIGEAGLLPDVLWWNGTGRRRPMPTDVDIALRLGAASDGLAVRSTALKGWRGAILTDLAEQGLAAVEAWAAGGGLNWRRLETEITTASPDAVRAAAPLGDQASFSRVSLAVWSDWTNTPPLALRPLLEACRGFNIEVLAPAHALHLEAAVRDMTPPGVVLQMRIVDLPARRNEDGLLRAMALAATGQSVLFCHGMVLPTAACVEAALAWSGRHGVGAVTAGISGRLAGLAITRRGDDWALVSAFDDELVGLDRPVLAAPAAFMAVSRTAIALALGPPASADSGEPFDLELSLLLRSAGRPSILLGSHELQAPLELADRWKGLVLSGHFWKSRALAAAATYSAPAAP